MRSPARNVVLQFDPDLDLLPTGKRLSGGMSAAVATQNSLWLVHDETVSVEMLQAEKIRGRAYRFARHRRFDLADFVSLPERASRSRHGAPPEADLEGIAFCDGYLWIAGSHSVLRDGIEKEKGSAAIAALAKARRSGNRFLIVRIPVASDGAGQPTLARHVRTDDGRVLHAARLAGGRKNNALTRVLRDDPHLGPFLSIPSKDNGFDVEGLAAAPGGRLFLGLRGPVIDGWACVLEIQASSHPRSKGELSLRRLNEQSGRATEGASYRKHFLDLGGAGIRDLALTGDDLLVLTGPPMRGRGTTEIRLWKNALTSRRESVLKGKKLPSLLKLPYRAKKDHPEGIALIGRKGERAWVLMIYDSVDKDSRLPSAAMRARLHELSLRR